MKSDSEKPLNVLVVEDDPVSRILLEGLLSKALTNINELISTETLEAAIDHLNEHSCDVVLLDLNLPDSEGLDTLKSIIDCGNDTAIVVITGDYDDDVGLEAVTQGAQEYLVKGRYDTYLLGKSISYAIERRRAAEKIKNLAKFPSEDPSPVLRISADCKITYANDASAPILKVWKCKEGGQLQPPQSKLIKEVLSSGKPTTFDLDCHDKIFATTMAPIEKSGYVNVYGLDITELRISKQNMEEVRKQATIKSQFISTVSHELRTPLTAMKGSVSILLEEAIGLINNEQRGILDIAKRNIDRLNRLIDDVLDLQKLETDKVEFNLQKNDINEIVEEIEKTMLPLTNKMGLKLITKFDRTLPRLNFDKDKIIQVLTNLVGNAAKFTDDGSITITTAKDDNNICVSVQDTGIGIKQEDLSRLFNEFEQLSNIDDRKTGGTGLGLAISRRIIGQHNGKIWAESEFGKGTTMSFVLPNEE